MRGIQESILTFLYQTVPGRMLLKPLVQPKVSRKVGWLLDSKLSTMLIQPFVRSAGIDLSEYEEKEYQSYNDFFTRKIKKEKRPIAMADNCLISPCDSKALVLPLSEHGKFHIKRSVYRLEQLLKDKKLAKRYEGGTAVILRLDVTDYHRYCYVDDGVVSSYRIIRGKFHTVQPIANDSVPVYHENTREYCRLKSKHFGDVIVMEVGALFVGRIVNAYHHEHRNVMRGQEKGRFEFGGSTVVLLFQKDSVAWRPDLLKRSACGIETAVKMGERIGKSMLQKKE